MPAFAFAIVYLLGYPASGKYTIAKALAVTPGRRWVVVDNHQINNVIFAVVEPDGVTPLPAAVWDRVEQVRDAVLTTIEARRGQPGRCRATRANTAFGAEVAHQARTISRKVEEPFTKGVTHDEDNLSSPSPHHRGTC